MMNNQNMYGAPYYGQPGFYYDPNYGQPWNYGNPQQQQMVLTNSITDEEAKEIQQKPGGNLNVNIDRSDAIKAMCSHKSEKGDPVCMLNDGSGNVICQICKTVWNPNLLSRDEVEVLVNQIVDQMENDKWIGNLPTQLVRDFYLLIPMLKKWPEIHEYAINSYNKLTGNQYMYNAQDYGAQQMFSSLMGGTLYNPAGYYGQPMYQQPYGQQPQQMPNQQYVPGQQPQAPVNNPAVNPMQAPYGYNPAAMNQQMVQQSQMMMPGGVNYAQPYANPGQFYQQQAQPQAPAMQTPVYAPQGQPQQAAAPVDQQAQASAKPAGTDAKINL